MNDMRELLSGALPAPQDEPQQRDVIDAAMDWGTRRRRRDWALSGAAALAVIAVGTGVAAMGGGSGSVGTAGTSRTSASASGGPVEPSGSWWTPECATGGSVKGHLADYCRLYEEEQNFSAEFAKGSVKYVQAVLPAGYKVKMTPVSVLVLTAPNGKTNYLYVSATAPDGQPLSCGTPPHSGCVQTSTAGGDLVVDPWPSGQPSLGYVKDGPQGPRIDVGLRTASAGGLNGIAAPTSAQPLLSTEQLAGIATDPGMVNYAKTQVQHLQDIEKQLNGMAPPSGGPSGGVPSGGGLSWSSSESSTGGPSGGSSESSTGGPSGGAGDSGPTSSVSRIGS